MGRDVARSDGARFRFRGLLAVVLGALGLVALPPGAALAATLPGGTPDPLIGSTFQGGDGNQDDLSVPDRVDWQHFLGPPNRVVHNPDQGLEFQSGSEQSPGGWHLTDEDGGVNPASANVLDAWSAVDQPNGDTFLYLAFTRDPDGSTGTTTTVFELNQDARTWDNDNDPATPEIPCRRDGDLLIRFDAHGNDPAVTVTLAKWETRATNTTVGCDTAGVLDVEESIPAGSAQGSTNPGPIASRLPGTLQGTISAPRVFGETALNLTRLFDVAFDAPCFSFGSIWMHSLSSNSFTASLKDFVAPQPVVVRTCAASGTKFYDRNANGMRDNGEPGIPGFLIWADYNNDGVLDPGEPSTPTDEHGHYVLKNIQPPPPGTYRLRETLLTQPQATSWRCSFPTANSPPGGGFDNGPGGLFHCGWGPIDPADEPNAEGRDFGNWVPAHLTLTKKLWPHGDPGRFNLLVNGQVVVAGAPADGATESITLEVPEGSYDISEAAVDPTDPGAYDSTVSCTNTPTRRGRLRSGPVFSNLELGPGNQATCVFTNVLKGSAAIAIEKTGPIVANAGDRLRYGLTVTNPGSVPLTDVHVTDPRCDRPPTLTSKRNADGDSDTTPDTLDPGDTWTFRCSHKTPAPSADCEVSTITNTASVTGSPPTGPSISDTSSITTTLRCPEVPPEPPLPPPTPPGPLPPTPTPTPGTGPSIVVRPETESRVPPAGQIGRTRLQVRAPCISRVSDARVVGTRIRRIQVTVNGRLVTQATLRILQRSARLLRERFPPGPHRVAVRVTFQRGSGTPPITLRRQIRVCGRVAPKFTG